MIKGEKQRAQITDLWDKQLCTISEDIMFSLICKCVTMRIILPSYTLFSLPTRRRNAPGHSESTAVQHCFTEQEHGWGCWKKKKLLDRWLDSQASLKRVKEEAGWLAICGHCINIYSFSVIRMAMAICLEKYIVKSSEFPPPYLGSLGRTVIDSKLFWISKKSFFLL